MIKKSTNLPKNKYLKKLYDSLTADRWVISTRGAPDYFGWKVFDNICVVAVRKASYKLRNHQKAVIEALAKAGVQSVTGITVIQGNIRGLSLRNRSFICNSIARDSVDYTLKLI